MNIQLLKWDIYEIEANESPLNGVSLRGRVRKFGLEKSINVLVENTQDTENGVRFAVLSDSDAQLVSGYIKKIIPGATIKLSMKSVSNPVLSKLRTNNPDRYNI